MEPGSIDVGVSSNRREKWNNNAGAEVGTEKYLGLFGLELRSRLITRKGGEGGPGTISTLKLKKKQKKDFF